MEQKLDLILNELQKLNDRVTAIETNMATKQDVEEIKRKLNTIYEQVAHNTEQEVKLDEVANKVKNLDTDVKLIKRMLTS